MAILLEKEGREREVVFWSLMFEYLSSEVFRPWAQRQDRGHFRDVCFEGCFLVALFPRAWPRLYERLSQYRRSDQSEPVQRAEKYQDACWWHGSLCLMRVCRMLAAADVVKLTKSVEVSRCESTIYFRPSQMQMQMHTPFRGVVESDRIK